MLVQQKSHHPGWDSGILCAYIGGGTGQGRTAIFVAVLDGGTAILLRCPAIESAASQICLHLRTGMCADYGVAGPLPGEQQSPGLLHLIIQICLRK